LPLECKNRLFEYWGDFFIAFCFKIAIRGKSYPVIGRPNGQLGTFIRRRENMKKLLVIMLLCIGFSGCAGGTMGLLFTNVKSSHDYVRHTSEAWQVGAKVGTAEVMNILGLVAIGDNSIKTAADSEKITKINFVDYEKFSVLGLFTRVTTRVIGE
jgi:hypothetical protein